MFKINDKCLCEHCFAQLSPKMKVCPYCSGAKNNDKYPTALAEGIILMGRYVVGRVLGKGGFGITYLCYDSKENRTVAVKEYLPDSLTHRNSGESNVVAYNDEREVHFKAGVKKFYEEAKLVSRFNGNPNIISVYEFFYENNTTYFVMEYLDGIDFKNYIFTHGGKISENEAVYILSHIADALMVVHSTGILHRDISPDNIFLCYNHDIKLIDFGAARQVVGEASKSLSVILKQGFAPLEQYQKHGKQGPWTDIYALGATMYFAVTGKLVDDAMSRLDDDALELSGLSVGFAGILKRMLAVKIADRYQDVFAVKRDLSALGMNAQEPVLPEKKAVKSFCESCGTEVESGAVLCKKCQSREANDNKLKSVFRPSKKIITKEEKNKSIEIKHKTQEALPGNEKPKSILENIPVMYKRGGIILAAGLVLLVSLGVISSVLKEQNEETINTAVAPTEAKEPDAAHIRSESADKGITIALWDSEYDAWKIKGEGIKYISNDTGIVTVDENGVIGAIGVGTATVEAIGKNSKEIIKVTVDERVNAAAVAEKYSAAKELLDKVNNDKSVDKSSFNDKISKLQQELQPYEDADFENMSQTDLREAQSDYDDKVEKAYDGLYTAYNSAKEAKNAKSSSAGSSKSGKSKSSGDAGYANETIKDVSSNSNNGSGALQGDWNAPPEGTFN